MKSTCPHCGTTYRIDPRKVPSGGVHARCSRCGGVFAIEVPSGATVSSGSPASQARPAPQQPPAFQRAAPQPPAPPLTPEDPFGDSEGQVDLPELGAPSPAARSVAEPQGTRPAPPAPPAVTEPAAAPPPQAPPPQRPSTPAAEPPRETPAPRPAPPTPPPLFGRPDPHGKARRLARALISDIAVYNPERRDRGLADGTLRQEFRDEIKKSWDEYVSQVGESIARSTPYFREALNEILAGGRTVF